MKALNNLKTSVKLIGAFVIIALIAVVIAFLGYSNMKTINDGMTTMYFDRLVPIRDLGLVEAYVYTIRGDVYKMLLIPSEAEKSVTAIATASEEIDAKIVAYKATSLLDTEVAELAVFEPAWAEYRAAVAEITAWHDAGNDEAAIASLTGTGRAATARKAVGASIDNLTEINVKSAEDTNTQADATFASAVLIVLISAGVAFLLALTIGIVISGSLSKPLGVLVKIATSVAVGDLVRDLDQKVKDSLTMRKDEVGDIAKAFDQVIIYMQGMGAVANTIAQNDLTVSVVAKSEKDELGIAFSKMIDSLQGAVGQVAESATSLSAASGQLATAANQAGLATSQIATTIQQVAKGTTQQSESVTKTAGSVEQMSRAIDGVAKGATEQAQAVAKAAEVTAELTSAIVQVGGNAQAVVKDSTQAATASRQGMETVEANLAAMGSIKQKVGESAAKVQEMGKRSNEIGAIVETIEDIASQTNLLALNAAIEAARAGEHGKGFAVVADEVRKLAERASSATKEIGGLIKGIQETVAEAVDAMSRGAAEVEVGVKTANDAGEALKNILKVSESVNRQAGEAATAAERMKRASDELVGAVDSVSAVVEQNTAATEEMAASSGEVTQAIENIASVSEENSAAVEEVSAAAEEMNAQVEEVTASAQAMAEMAEELKAIVSKFKLTASAPSGAPPPTPPSSGAPVPGPKTDLHVAARPSGNGKRHERQLVAEGGTR